MAIFWWNIPDEKGNLNFDIEEPRAHPGYEKHLTESESLSVPVPGSPSITYLKSPIVVEILQSAEKSRLLPPPSR